MPLPFLAELYVNGTPAWMPDAWLLGRAAAAVGVVALAKVYFGGRRNGSERNMHGKVVLVTGGTSGVGAAAALELARRGAQVVLLTRQPASAPAGVELVDELRARAGHEMVYAEAGRPGVAAERAALRHALAGQRAAAAAGRGGPLRGHAPRVGGNPRAGRARTGLSAPGWSTIWPTSTCWRC